MPSDETPWKVIIGIIVLTLCGVIGGLFSNSDMVVIVSIALGSLGLVWANVNGQQADVGCDGYWSACTVLCESAADRSFVVTTAPSGSGTACPTAATDCTANEDACIDPTLESGAGAGGAAAEAARIAEAEAARLAAISCNKPIEYSAGSEVAELHLAGPLPDSIPALNFAASFSDRHAACAANYTGTVTAEPCAVDDEPYTVNSTCSPSTCVPPTGLAVAGYNLSSVPATADLTMGSFSVTGVRCEPEYSEVGGTSPSAGTCPSDGEEYTLSGCVFSACQGVNCGPNATCGPGGTGEYVCSCSHGYVGDPVNDAPISSVCEESADWQPSPEFTTSVSPHLPTSATLRQSCNVLLDSYMTTHGLERRAACSTDLNTTTMYPGSFPSGRTLADECPGTCAANCGGCKRIGCRKPMVTDFQTADAAGLYNLSPTGLPEMIYPSEVSSDSDIVDGCAAAAYGDAVIDVNGCVTPEEDRIPYGVSGCSAGSCTRPDPWPQEYGPPGQITETLAMNGFAVSGITCTDASSMTPFATRCDHAGEQYELSGCATEQCTGKLSTSCEAWDANSGTTCGDTYALGGVGVGGRSYVQCATDGAVCSSQPPGATPCIKPSNPICLPLQNRPANYPTPLHGSAADGCICPSGYQKINNRIEQVPGATHLGAWSCKPALPQCNAGGRVMAEMDRDGAGGDALGFAGDGNKPSTCADADDGLSSTMNTSVCDNCGLCYGQRWNDPNHLQNEFLVGTGGIRQYMGWKCKSANSGCMDDSDAQTGGECLLPGETPDAQTINNRP